MFRCGRMQEARNWSDVIDKVKTACAAASHSLLLSTISFQMPLGAHTLGQVHRSVLFPPELASTTFAETEDKHVCNLFCAIEREACSNCVNLEVRELHFMRLFGTHFPTVIRAHVQERAFAQIRRQPRLNQIGFCQVLNSFCSIGFLADNQSTFT